MATFWVISTAGHTDEEWQRVITILRLVILYTNVSDIDLNLIGSTMQTENERPLNSLLETMMRAGPSCLVGSTLWANKSASQSSI